jgi:hypothetical protein
MRTMRVFDVFLLGREIETVFYDQDVTTAEVKKSLVNHDGYDPRIVVRERKN